MSTPQPHTGDDLASIIFDPDANRRPAHPDDGERGFRTVIGRMVEEATEDVVDNSFTASIGWHQIKLRDLFNLTVTHWHDRFKEHPVRSLDNELALYEGIETTGPALVDGRAGASDRGMLDDATGNLLLSSF